MGKTIRDLFFLSIITLALTLTVWLPHLLQIHSFYKLDFSSGFNTIVRNYDGLEYVVIAKTFYDPQKLIFIPQDKSPAYYASHFPGYSLMISLFAPLFGYLKSMLFVSLLFTIFSVSIFYLLVKNFHLTTQPLWLSILFLLLPARWLIVHSIGSSEPMFIFLVLLALFFFLRFERYSNYSSLLMCTVFGSLAQLTRPPGILLFVSLVLYIHWKFYRQSKSVGLYKAWLSHLRYFPLIFIPLTLISVFYLFKVNLNDFWSYFHSGDNIHLTFPPFQVFNKNQFWVGEIWLEDIIYIFILSLFGVFYLWRQKLYPISFFVFVYLLAFFSVAHRDIARYSLPIFPFLLIAFEKVLVSREFKIVMAVLVLAIYLYAQNFILGNTAPIPNLEVFN